MSSSDQHNQEKIMAPKIKSGATQWKGYKNKPWYKKDRHKVTLMFNFLERRKSYFLSAYFKRQGINFIDMGDHVKEDVTYGRLYGNRMECNPMYFTSGSFIRNLLKIEKETGLSRKEISEKYIFLCGGGQCGPCRYGMYPQEYLKVANEAGFKDFRVLIFSSDLGKVQDSKMHAFNFNLNFRINIAFALILADLIHAAECSLRAYAVDKNQVDETIKKAEKMILKAFESKYYYWKINKTLKKVGDMFAAIELKKEKLPLIFVTGEFFANLAHNDGNYHLRRFITDEGCEVLPGSFTQRSLYDNWRRVVEANRTIKHSTCKEEIKRAKKSIKKQRSSTYVINYLYNRCCKAFGPQRFRAHTELMDLEHMSQLALDYYHPEIFGGEGHLEVAEAISLASENKIDGFISCKPFGCMPSSGVSDGVQTKIVSMFPNLNFLSIETSGDNDVSILSRVSMLLFKAKHHFKDRAESLSVSDAVVSKKKYSTIGEESAIKDSKEQFA